MTFPPMLPALARISVQNSDSREALTGMRLAEGTSMVHAAINDTPARRTIPDWLTLIRSEYLEMPGLLLTRSQAQRLWGLDAVACEALLNALVDARFLRRTSAGAYLRADCDVRWPAA